MKTTIETVNKMVYKTTGHDKQGNPVHITISLDDDCKNGHADFSITATVYEKGKPQNDRNTICFGCCHDEILQARPDLKVFIDLHLSDVTGVPMYAVGNGFYHLKNSSAETARDYIRATQTEFDQIATSEDETVFQYWLERLGIVERWRLEANKAIAMLEEWTGQKFKDTSTKLPYKSLNGKFKDVEKRVLEGYYSPENIQAREHEKIKEKRAQIAADIKTERDKEVTKAETEYTVKMAVHNAGLPIENFIFYNHTHEGVFNWLDYEKKITPAQLAEFENSDARKSIPFQVTFKLK